MTLNDVGWFKGHRDQLTKDCDARTELPPFGITSLGENSETTMSRWQFQLKDHVLVCILNNLSMKPISLRKNYSNCFSLSPDLPTWALPLHSTGGSAPCLPDAYSHRTSQSLLPPPLDSALFDVADGAADDGWRLWSHGAALLRYKLSVTDRRLAARSDWLGHQQSTGDQRLWWTDSTGARSHRRQLHHCKALACDGSWRQLSW